MLSERLAQVRERIRQTCARCGRDPSTVTLIGVTKGIPIEPIQEAVTLGLTELGENRVQEARDKQYALGSRFKAVGKDSGLQPPASSLQPMRWHLIGHLQRNKAKLAVELFDVIHSVDSVELADDLERYVAKRVQGSGLGVGGKNRGPIDVFIQVNVSGERTKFGCTPEQAITLAQVVSSCAHLQLKGLMTIAPLSDDPENARKFFRELRELRESLVMALSPQPRTLSLSMGMSQDFEVAIEEGADVVRIGTAIFGKRE